MKKTAAEGFAPDAPFRYVGGDPSLDFVNTVNWTPDGREWSRDRFTDYGRLIEWASGARVIDAAGARRLRHAASRHPRRAAATFDAAFVARRLLRGVLASLATKSPSATALEPFNALVADVAPHVRVVRGSENSLARGWDDPGNSPEAILWPVVWSAVDLIATPDAIDRLRMCAGEECGWLYIDRSRNGLRRWCEMSVCGTVEKNRRRRLA